MNGKGQILYLAFQDRKTLHPVCFSEGEGSSQLI
jgi:hypothetical protein